MSKLTSVRGAKLLRGWSRLCWSKDQASGKEEAGRAEAVC